MNWESIKEAVLNFLKTGGVSILKAVLLLIAGLIVIRIIVWIFKKIFSKTKLDKITQGFIISVLKTVLWVVLGIAILQQLGVAVTGIVAVLSSCGLAVGLALQGSLSNVANGMIIIANKPFVEGDFVNIDGYEGTVKSIKILTTTIVTPDNKTIVLPNSSAVNGAVTNYTGRHTRRVDFNFGVAYESDVDLVKKIILDVINSNGLVFQDPKPFCALKTLDSSSINFFANCWCDSEDYWTVYYYVVDKVFNEFKKNNIAIPYNQIEIRERKDEVVMPYKDEKLPKRVEKVRQEKEETMIEKLEKLMHKKTKKRKSKKTQTEDDTNKENLAE